MHSKKESTLMREQMVALSARGHLVFRANVGKFMMHDGRWFDTGLPKGFSDLFGVASDGYPFFIESKTVRGSVRDEQVAFLSAMSARGIRAGVARSVEDAVRIAEGVPG